MNEKIQKVLDRLKVLEEAYECGEQMVSDAAYDLLRDSILPYLDADHPYLDKVGHNLVSNWPKAPHVLAMTSQNKVCEESLIRAWVSKVETALGQGPLTYVLQHKLDGFSIELLYKKGLLDKAVTRGGGGDGEDVCDNVRLFRGVPGHVKVEDKEVAVRVEGLLWADQFAKVQRDEPGRYKNARNGACGIGRRYDGRHSKRVRVLAYDVNAKVDSELKKIEVLEQLGFQTVPTYKCQGIEEVLKVYRDYRDSKRAELPYAIDGIVMKINSVELQERLGVKHGRPEGQVALKFEPEGAVTTLVSIEVQLGRTGKITPVAYLEGVGLDGSTIERASLHNFAYIKDNDIGPGAMVKISKRGEIIPQVEEVVSPGDTYERPTHCPSCQSPLEFDGVNLWCRSKVCPDRDIARITYWVKTLDMKGFSDKFIKKLYDSGKAKAVPDLYKLTADDLVGLGGIGEKTALKFIETLEKTSLMSMDKFLTALGVPTLSTETAKDLTEKFGGFEKIASASQQDIMSMEGYAETSARILVDGLLEYRDLARELLSVVKIKEKASGPLSGMSFCVTGSLRSMSRKEFQDAVEGSGGAYKSSVVQGLGYLVSNEKSGSSKFQKASKLGVQVIDEDAFLLMLGDRVTVKVEEPKKETIKLVTETLF